MISVLLGTGDIRFAYDGNGYYIIFATQILVASGTNCTRNDIYYFITVKDPNGVGKKIEIIGEFLSSVSFSGTKF